MPVNTSANWYSYIQQQVGNLHKFWVQGTVKSHIKNMAGLKGIFLHLFCRTFNITLAVRVYPFDSGRFCTKMFRRSTLIEGGTVFLQQQPLWYRGGCLWIFKSHLQHSFDPPHLKTAWTQFTPQLMWPQQLYVGHWRNVLEVRTTLQSVKRFKRFVQLIKNEATI